MTTTTMTKALGGTLFATLLTFGLSCTKEDIQTSDELIEGKEIQYLAKAPVASFICYNAVSTTKLYVESNCSTMGWLQPGVNPSCIQPTSQGVTTLSVEGIASVCSSGQSFPFVFNKGPNSTTCGQVYYIQDKFGPPSRKVLQLQLKGSTVAFGPGVGGYFTYNLGTGQWSALGAAATYFCYSFINPNQVPAVCC